ncbi:MAG: LacI family DNA-binding transcriptional regulator [Opitutaceae bacterium]
MSIGKPDRPISSTSALARHLGLSRWTISRVLNGHAGVREETVIRVREAMKDLGFVPSVMARGLRGGRTGLIGISFQGFDIPIFVQKVAVLQTALRRVGLRSLIELTDRDPGLERDVAAHFVSVGVEGIVLVGGPAGSGTGGVVDFLRDRAIPTVIIDPGVSVPLPTVEMDRGEGMRLILHHLRQLGHRRPVLLGLDRTIAYGPSRWRGIDSVAVEEGLDPASAFTTILEETVDAMDYDYGRRLADRVLGLSPRPTALVALNDQVAIGAMARLQESGIEIPRDLSMVGFDNLEVSAHVSPSLTTIDQRVTVLMQAGIDLLRNQMDSGFGAAVKPVRIKPNLVIRRSTGPAPRGA